MFKRLTKQKIVALLVHVLPRIQGLKSSALIECWNKKRIFGLDHPTLFFKMVYFAKLESKFHSSFLISTNLGNVIEYLLKSITWDNLSEKNICSGIINCVVNSLRIKLTYISKSTFFPENIFFITNLILYVIYFHGKNLDHFQAKKICNLTSASCSKLMNCLATKYRTHYLLY